MIDFYSFLSITAFWVKSEAPALWCLFLHFLDLSRRNWARPYLGIPLWTAP